MIIKGNVQTMKGPVSIASLSEGNMVITEKRIPAKVMSIRKLGMDSSLSGIHPLS